MEEITKQNPAIIVHFVSVDFLDNNSVRVAAQNIRAITDQIDVLVNNAGVMAVRDYGLSKDGIERQFAANHVGHFLLTNLLMKEILAAGNRASIVNVSSLGYQLGEVNLDDPNFKVLFTVSYVVRTSANSAIGWQEGKTYNPWHAYGQSKTANILFTYGLAKRLEGKGVAVFALQPGGK
jgi:NAD(P)-dependent dehydrogenase (short-subunit alcohol dehydrogenase family)